MTAGRATRARPTRSGPEDIAAATYYALAPHATTKVHDPFNRPHHFATGKPIVELFG
jgi:hypothetical protein